MGQAPSLPGLPTRLQLWGPEEAAVRPGIPALRLVREAAGAARSRRSLLAVAAAMHAGRACAALRSSALERGPGNCNPQPAASPPAVPHACRPGTRCVPAHCGVDKQDCTATDGSGTLYLLVWAGALNSPKACNDRLFVLDATPGSPNFTNIVASAQAPTGGNEPHHVGLSVDGRVRPGSGQGAA